MKFPITKQEDGSLALEVSDDLLQQLTSMSSSQADAQLKESEGKVAELQEKLTAAEGRYATLNDVLATFSAAEQKQLIVEVGKLLSPEGFVNFAIETGHLAHLVPATEAEVAEGEEPNIIRGKTTKPGYKYLEHLNLSVKEV